MQYLSTKSILILILLASLISGSSEAGDCKWTSLSGPAGGSIASLAIDPTSPQTLYAGTGPWGNLGGVFKSIDGGANWRVTGLTNTRVNALAIDPKSPQTLYAGSDVGMFKSTNGRHEEGECVGIVRYARERVGMGAGLVQFELLFGEPDIGSSGTCVRLGPGHEGRMLVLQSRPLPVGDSLQLRARLPQRLRFRLPVVEEYPIVLGDFAL